MPEGALHVTDAALAALVEDYARCAAGATNELWLVESCVSVCASCARSLCALCFVVLSSSAVLCLVGGLQLPAPPRNLTRGPCPRPL